MDPKLLIRKPIEAELAQYAALFEAVMTHKEGFMGQFLDYVRQRKGKMMRPMLVLLLAKAWGEVTEATLRSAVCLELLHTSSLIHDDVVDESNERRGMAAVHQVYDNKIAVLLGDFMLAKTLEQSALSGSLEVVKTVAHLGATLAEGEILQLEHVHQEAISEETYYTIIRRKTASLFEACGLVAALTSGVSAEQLERARSFGEKVGLCFQIRDDIFDYFDDAAIGKPRGNDMAEGKLTLPVIYALKQTADAEAMAIAQRVKQGVADREEIARLIDFAKQHGGIAHAEARMEELRHEAVGLLAGVPQTEVREALTAYIDYVIGRQS